MATSPVLSFTSQDYESLIEDITRFAVTTFPLELWSTEAFTESNVGTYLLRTEAYIGDLLGYQLNASVMETILARVVRERNLRLLALGVGYHMQSASAASTTLRIYDLPTPPNVAYPFTISKHHQFSINGVIFQPESDTTVTTGSVLNNVDDGYYVDIAVVQGEESFAEVLGVSNGRPSQQFVLSSYPFIDGTLEVSVTVDGGYSKVDSFTTATPTDEFYRTYGDENGVLTVEFGNGVSGKIPSLGQTITATYRTGGGIEGNFQEGLLTWSAVGSTSGGSPLPSVVQAASIRNLTAAVGGGPAETVFQAKRNITGYLRTNDRFLTALDYADGANLVAGVAHATSMVGKPVLGSRPIYLFLVPNGGGAPSDPLLDATGAYIATRKEPGRAVIIGGARYVDAYIGVDAYLKDGARRPTVLGYLQTAITLTFNVDTLDFSSVFPLQAMYDTLDPDNIPGLQRVYIREFRLESGWDTYVSRPPVGNGLVSYINAPRALAVTREWNVRFTNPTPPLTCPEYKVYERVSGKATAVTNNSVTDNGGYFIESAYVGWTVIPKPEDGSDSLFTVTANTARKLTTSGLGLGTYLNVGDPFSVEKYVSNGKVIVSTVTVAVVASTDITASITNFAVDDEVLVVAAGFPDVRAKIVSFPGGLIRLSVPVTVGIGDTVSFVWKDPAGRMEFALTQGTSPWAVGDEIFVDSYATVADLSLRGSDFPVLDPGNVDISLIGGVDLCSSPT